MSKKGLKTMLVCIVLLIGLVTLFACNKSDVADKDGQTKVIVKIQDEDGSIYKENVVFSDLFTLSLQKEGYTGRLYRDADFLKPLTKDSKVKNGDTVYVKWTINKYTVTFMDGKDVLATFTNVPHGSAVTAPEVPEKDGKTFVGWDKKFDNVTSDLTINAVYDVDTFTVTFKDGEKVLETQTVEYAAAATAPDTARLSPPEGMHFSEWDKEFSKVTENMEVSAVYELNEYTVTFKNGETTIKTERVKHGFAATAPKKVPDKATEKFVGWDKPFDKVTSDIIVNAKFETKKFTLTFINFDGTTVHTAEVEYGASIDSDFEKADKAATFNGTILDYEGWYKADGTRIDELDLPTMPAENFTLTLKLRLLDSAIGDNTAITVSEGFTYGEKSATFTVSGDTYDGVNYEYEWTILKDGKEYKKQTTTSGSIKIENPDAGTYVANVKIVASKEGCGSVEKDFTAGETLTVSRADISGITVTGGTFTYGDENAKIKIDGLKDGDKVFYGTDGVSFSSEIVDFSKCDVGEYTYYVKVERNENYNAKTLDVTINIVKAAVTITFTPDKNDEVVYGDELPSLSAYVGETKIGTVAKEDYALKLNEISFSGIATYVGECSIEVKNFTNDYYNTNNFNITFSSYKITVKKATLNVNIAEISNLTYGDDLPEIGYEIKGWKNGDDKSEYKLLPETKYAKKSAVGTYSFTYNVSGEKIGYYDVTVNTVEFTVKQRAATITINKVNNIIYGDKVPDLSAKVDEVLAGDSLSYTLNTDYTVGAKRGNYTARVEFNPEAAENKNYAITVNTVEFTVVPKSLTIKLNNTPTVAVGKTYTVYAEHLEKIGLVAGDTVTEYVTITKDVAGVYNKATDFDTTHLVVTNADCYVISYEMSVEFVEVTLAIDFADVTLTYDGNAHGVSVTKTVESKNYTITYGTTENDCTLTSSPEYTNEGTYTIYFKVVDNDTLADYVGSVTLTIKKKAVEIKVDDVTITYGEKPAFSYTVTGLVEGETLSGEAVYSGAGKDVGEYDISVSGLTASDNYNVNFVSGKLTIDQKTAEVVWNVAKDYTYSPDGQIVPTAKYDSKTATLIFTKDGQVCDFKNAGTYTVTVKEDKNYTLSGETTKTITINKAKYTSVTAHTALSGTYDPNKTLGNYALSEGFTWVNPDEVPVCTKTEYAAKYNMDTANYEDFVTKVTLTLQKATVTLAQNLFEFNYDGASHEIGTTVKYNNIEVTELYTLTFDKNMFSAAGTHKTTATLTADNFALSDNVVYVKVKGVKVGNNYYTIEDALNVATSGQTIFVLNDTAFATQEIAGVLYDDIKFKTVKTGVTLLLPFNENDTVGHIGAGKDGSANYKATAALTGTAKLYKTLVIPEGVEVIVNGKLVVGAQTGKIAAGSNQNAVSGNYCEISLGGTITLNNATLEVYGYIKGNGEITANNTTVIENLYLSGWMGGTDSAVRYIGNDKISVLSLAFSGELKIDNPTQFPFSQYELRSIEAKLVVNKGSKLQGYTKIATSELSQAGVTVPAQINEAVLTFVSSDANKTDSGLFRLVGNNSRIEKTVNGDRVKITLFGEIKDGYTSISIMVVKKTVSMTSQKVFFPIDGRTDITLKNGATLTQEFSYKLMPGATITVENGGVYNINGRFIMYDKSFTDISTYPYPGTARGDAKVFVNGTMNINGSFGGKVASNEGGVVNVATGATISDVHSAEGGGKMTREGLTAVFTYNDTHGVTKSLEFVNANTTTVAAATNKTYNYNNGKWQ